jgi:CheY-like chemotaxis protein
LKRLDAGPPIIFSHDALMKNGIMGPVSLLYVEDDAPTREMVTKVLKKNGFDCIVAENGHTGLELYRRHSPEIVLSDIMMPVMSGLEMARAIRADFPETQFIFMTALGDSKSILEAVEIGITQYVVKPVDLSKLLAAITQCVAILRLKAEAHRVKHLEAIGVLAGGLAHDFNNMLQIVLGNVHLAKKFVNPTSEAFTYLKQAESISVDARNLGKRLGTLARRESGLKRKMQLTPVIIYSVEAAISGTSIVSSFNLPPDIPQVSFNKTQLEQVFSHLTVNAIEAMPQGGRLEIAACVSSLPLGSGSLLAPGDYISITFRHW